MTEPAVIQCSQLTKRFSDGGLETDVLNDINLSINKGDKLAIVGSSGSGKSTLLHLLGGLDEPSHGKVEIHGQDINALSVKDLSKLRNQSLGFVYQFHHLLPEFTAVENVAIPLVIGGITPKYAQQQAEELLFKVGLGHRLGHKPSELSGGERQRAHTAHTLTDGAAHGDDPAEGRPHRPACRSRRETSRAARTRTNLVRRRYHERAVGPSRARRRPVPFGCLRRRCQPWRDRWH